MTRKRSALDSKGFGILDARRASKTTPINDATRSPLMPKTQPCPCNQHDVETSVRLSSGWVRVCRRCAAHVQSRIAADGHRAPGVILSSKAAQLAFDGAYGDGVSVGDAFVIAVEVEAAVHRAGVASAVARRLVVDPRTWSSAALAN